jgi:hypothetical protein
MTHDHDEILELASASLDFELTAAERSRLEAGLAGCERCREAATTYRRQASLVAALPMVDASPVIRRRIERAAGARPQRTNWSWYLAAAALVALLGASIVAVGALRDRRGTDLSDVAVTPTPSAAVSPNPSPSVPASGPVDADVIELDPPSGALADVGPPLPQDSLAVVSVRNLRLRSQPFVAAASIKYEPFLQPADRLFIVDGPVIGHNYEWYQVAAWRPGSRTPSWPVGWVARAGHDGEEWIRPQPAACPGAPVDIVALEALAPAERLACFGHETLTVRAVIGETGPAACAATRTGCLGGPRWLAEASVSASDSASGQGTNPLTVAVAPGTDAAAGSDPQVAQLRGAFDDPASADCVPDLAAPSAVAMSTSEARFICRTRFVASRIDLEPATRRQDAAITISDRLRVRSLPEVSEASIRYEPLLPIGTRLAVLDGPTLGSGYAWFRVLAPITGPDRTTVTDWRVGWVAAAGKDGQAWIRGVTFGCPRDTSVRVADLASLRKPPIDDGALLCFGPSTIALDGTARLRCDGTTDPADPTAWLSARAGRRLEIRDGSSTVVARLAPGTDLGIACGAALSTRSRFLAHFDDDAASGCTADAAGRPVDREVAEYLCRTRLVVVDRTSIGG